MGPVSSSPTAALQCDFMKIALHLFGSVFLPVKWGIIMSSELC